MPKAQYLVLEQVDPSTWRVVNGVEATSYISAIETPPTLDECVRVAIPALAWRPRRVGLEVVEAVKSKPLGEDL